MCCPCLSGVLYCTHQAAVGREAGMAADWQWGQSEPREECCGLLSLLWEGSSAVGSWLLPHMHWAGVDLAFGVHLIFMEFLTRSRGQWPLLDKAPSSLSSPQATVPLPLLDGGGKNTWYEKRLLALAVHCC